MRLKKLLVGGLALVILLSTFGIYNVLNAADIDHNYAEALQKSMYFYDANRCGPGISEDTKLQWRGDCHTEDAAISINSEKLDSLPDGLLENNLDVFDPDGDGLIDLSGGYHDAGDHVRFGLPQSYSFSTLGWGYYEFKKAYQEIGEEEHIISILKGFADCTLKSTFINDSGEVIAYNYMVGEGSDDHTYWGPPELQDNTGTHIRPADFATTESPASDQTAGAAAGLAVMYMNFKDTEPDYAKECLEKAVALYEFSVENRGIGLGDGFYGSAYDHDELSWAATWLYEATGNLDYIRDIDAVDENGNYVGYMSRIISTTENTWQNIWVHCWDVVWGGVFTKLAYLFPEREDFNYYCLWNIEYWGGEDWLPHENTQDTAYLAQTPAGYGMINTWGSARYNTAAQFCALTYQKYNPERTDIGDWAKFQMDYILGDNPMGYAYLVGYGEKSVEHPHHRAAHASKTNSMLNPTEHKHILWGALAGGPDATDKHVDDTTDYVYNEVAIDYNAAVVGTLAGHYLLYGEGDKPIADFPPKEEKIDAYYCEAKLEQENSERSQITLKIHNESVHPPAFNNQLNCRYYFDISELLDKGQTIDDISFATMYDENKFSFDGPVVITGPVATENKAIYYMEFSWESYQIYGDREYQFALVAGQDSNWKSNWNAENDFSRLGISEDEHKINDNIPVYLGDELVYGNEPDFDSIPPYEPTVVPTDNGSTVDNPTNEPGIIEPANLKLESYNNINSNIVTNSLFPRIRLTNNTGRSINLADLSFKYFYTIDGLKGQNFYCDQAAVVASSSYTSVYTSVVGQFVTMEIPKENADTYLEVSFSNDVKSLDNGEYVLLEFRIAKNDWSNYNQENDFSFNPEAKDYVISDNIGVYLNNELLMGQEP